MDPPDNPFQKIIIFIIILEIIIIKLKNSLSIYMLIFNNLSD